MPRSGALLWFSHVSSLAPWRNADPQFVTEITPQSLRLVMRNVHCGPLRRTAVAGIFVLIVMFGLATPPSACAQEAEIEVPVTVSSENGNSQELTLGLDPDATDGIDSEFGEEEQPPVSPGFDVRLIDDDIPPSGFGEGLLIDIRQGSVGVAGEKKYEIQFRADNPGTEITIHWTLPDGITGTIEDKWGGNTYGPVDMSESDSIAVDSGAPEAIIRLESTAIPVELTGLDSQLAGNSVRLTWQTASETNNAGFYIQRKQGGSHWQRLGFVGSNAQGGTTSERQSYRFTDADLPYAADSLIYRLRQVDTDGAAHVSDRTVLRLGGPNRLTLQHPFPNPARRQAKVRFGIPKPATVQVAIYDLLGRRVTTLVAGRLEAGRHAERMSVSSLAPGMYFIRLEAGGKTQTRKLTVVR